MNSLTQAKATTTGKDDFAKFDVYTPAPSATPYCQCCTQEVEVAIKYRDTKEKGITSTLRRLLGNENLKPPFSNLILKSPSRPIGVTCGCYARFHRQIAHITTNMKHRAGGPVG